MSESQHNLLRTMASTFCPSFGERALGVYDTESLNDLSKRPAPEERTGSSREQGALWGKLGIL